MIIKKNPPPTLDKLLKKSYNITAMTKRITVFAIQYTFFSLGFGCNSKIVKKLFENAKVGTEIAKQTNKQTNKSFFSKQCVKYVGAFRNRVGCSSV